MTADKRFSGAGATSPNFGEDGNTSRKKLTKSGIICQFVVGGRRTPDTNSNEVAMSPVCKGPLLTTVARNATIKNTAEACKKLDSHRNHSPRTRTTEPVIFGLGKHNEAMTHLNTRGINIYMQTGVRHVQLARQTSMEV